MIRIHKDAVFYCMKWPVLKLQCGVFALHCVTKLLFAFIWDRIVPQIHRVQRPIDLEHASQGLRPCGTNLVPPQLQCLQGAVRLERLAQSSCTFISDIVVAEIR